MIYTCENTLSSVSTANCLKAFTFTYHFRKNENCPSSLFTQQYSKQRDVPLHFSPSYKKFLLKLLIIKDHFKKESISNVIRRENFKRSEKSNNNKGLSYVSDDCQKISYVVIY